MHLGFLLTFVPLGSFLTWANISTIRQKWTYLVVGDSYLPGKPSLAMLPLGLWMVALPFGNVLLDLGNPTAGLFSVFSTGCLALGLIGCFWVPRVLHPHWMKQVDEQMKSGTDAHTLEYRRRVLGLAPDGKNLTDDKRQAPDATH